jgi:mycothiol synthase
MMTIPFHLPDAPAIAGLHFRPARGVEDAEALYAVHTGRLAHDGIDPLSNLEDVPSLEGLRAALSQAAAGRQLDQWLVAQIYERVVGYSQLECWPEGDGTWVYLTLGWVLPEWRGQGIGAAMLHWTEARIRRLAAADHPGAQIELAANASSTEKEATALLLYAGYRAGYTILEMGLDATTPVPEHPLPAGMNVRPVLPDHYPLIAASIHEFFQQEYDEGRFNEWFDFDLDAAVARLRYPKHDSTLWQVAWEGNRIAGLALSVVENGVGEVFELCVHPACRRRGLGRALMARAIHSLRARGVEVIRIRTNADFRTRAKDLYRSVGFRILKEFPRYRKPFS